MWTFSQKQTELIIMILVLSSSFLRSSFVMAWPLTPFARAVVPVYFWCVCIGLSYSRTHGGARSWPVICCVSWQFVYHDHFYGAAVAIFERHIPPSGIDTWVSKSYRSPLAEFRAFLGSWIMISFEILLGLLYFLSVSCIKSCLESASMAFSSC